MFYIDIRYLNRKVERGIVKESRDTRDISGDLLKYQNLRHHARTDGKSVWNPKLAKYRTKKCKTRKSHFNPTGTGLFFLSRKQVGVSHGTFFFSSNLRPDPDLVPMSFTCLSVSRRFHHTQAAIFAYRCLVWAHSYFDFDTSAPQITFGIFVCFLNFAFTIWKK